MRRTTEDRQTAGLIPAFLSLHLAKLYLRLHMAELYQRLQPPETSATYATLDSHAATLSKNESTFTRQKVTSASKEVISQGNKEPLQYPISANSLRHPSNKGTRQQS